MPSVLRCMDFPGVIVCPQHIEIPEQMPPDSATLHPEIVACIERSGIQVRAPENKR